MEGGRDNYSIARPQPSIAHSTEPGAPGGDGLEIFPIPPQPPPAAAARQLSETSYLGPEFLQQ